ncbi:MAG: anaerobic ribonucleoside-triphosphate reductase activating protein [Saccharofermentanales bacterium]
MIISGIVKSSLVDYPGFISCVLFVPGCNFNCFYCHNRSLIDGSHDIIAPGYVEDFLEKRKGLLDGVVITGGEPTLQPDLIPYIRHIRRLGYKVKLDTNGSSPRIITQLLEEGLCDYFAVDYKAPASRYKEISGSCVDSAVVLDTIKHLTESKMGFEVRTTVIPQLGENDLLCMSKELPILPRYVLNRFRKPEKFLACDETRVSENPYTQSRINEFVQIIRFNQPNATS